MRAALFVLGVLVAGTVAALFELLQLPAAISCAGVALLAMSEWLVRDRRLFGAGIEEALWAAGLVMIGLDVSGVTNGNHEALALWLVCAALAAAGFRMLNPFLVTVAAALSSIALYTALRGQTQLGLPGWTDRSFLASLLCYVGALGALSAGARQYRRPSHDRMLDGLACALPVAGYLWVSQGWASYSTLDYRHAHSLREFYVPAAPLLMAGVLLATGLRRRTHAPLAGAMACAACLAVELHHSSDLGLATRLLLEGGVLLAACVAVGRYLRTPRRGIHAQRSDPSGSVLDVLQQGAAVGLGATHLKPAEPGFQGGGGKSAGGGASGTF